MSQDDEQPWIEDGPLDLSPTGPWVQHLSAIFEGTRVQIPPEAADDPDGYLLGWIGGELAEAGVPYSIARYLVSSVAHEAGAGGALESKAARQGRGLTLFYIGWKLGRNPTPLEVPDHPPESP